MGSSYLVNSLIFWLNWHGFNKLVRQYLGVRSYAMPNSDARLSDTATREGQLAGPIQETSGHMVTVMSCPHFVLITKPFYHVSHDTHTGEEHKQFLVPKSQWELLFQVAHYNLIVRHTGYG